VELDPNDKNNWDSLGEAGGGSVRGQSYSKEECYAKKKECEEKEDETDSEDSESEAALPDEIGPAVQADADSRQKALEQEVLALKAKLANSEQSRAAQADAESRQKALEQEVAALKAMLTKTDQAEAVLRNAGNPTPAGSGLRAIRQRAEKQDDAHRTNIGDESVKSRLELTDALLGAGAPLEATQSGPALLQWLASKGISKEEKFTVRTLIFGKSSAAADDIEDLLGMDEHERSDAINKAGGNILKALTKEIHDYCSNEHKANWQYIIEGRACEESFIPEHVKEDAKKGAYHGGKDFLLQHYDQDHNGWSLDDFMRLQSSKLANLQQHHVAVLRLYTTSTYDQINGPLRTEKRPHPLALVVFYINEGLKKLRKVRAKTDPKDFNSQVVLWRGLSNSKLDMHKFQEEGGTELAPMSTTRSWEIAKKYSDSAHPLILRYTTSGLTTGVCMQFLSVYPKEEEYLYPPGTFLQFVSQEKDAEGRTIITITPTMR